MKLGLALGFLFLMVLSVEHRRGKRRRVSTTRATEWWTNRPTRRTGRRSMMSRVSRTALRPFHAPDPVEELLAPEVS